jgi:hypothetical protein
VPVTVVMPLRLCGAQTGLGSLPNDIRILGWPGCTLEIDVTMGWAIEPQFIHFCFRLFFFFYSFTKTKGSIMCA